MRVIEPVGVSMSSQDVVATPVPMLDNVAEQLPVVGNGPAGTTSPANTKPLTLLRGTSAAGWEHIKKSANVGGRGSDVTILLA